MKKKVIAIVSVLVVAAAATVGIITLKNNQITADPENYAGVGKNQGTEQVAESNIISKDEALGKALAHADLKEANITLISNHLLKDDGIYEYDIEFISGSKSYEYEIHAGTGTVVSCDIDLIRQTTNNPAAPGGTTAPASEDINKVTTTKAEQLIGVISTDAALDIALKHAGLKENEVTVTKNRFDDDGHIDIEFYTANKEYDYEISATKGTVIECDIDYIKTTAATTAPTTKAPAQNNYIDRDSALQIALNHAGIAKADAREIEVELDNDNRVKHYEVEFKSGRTEYSYDINAETGKIIRSEKDFDD